MSDLSTAYRRLMFAYPGRYRRERGDELVDLYLEMAGNRSRPRPSDAVDLIRGGLRERLRAAGLSGVADGLPAAAVIALAALGAISVYYLATVEIQHLWPSSVDLPVGPFRTPAALAYLGCLVSVLAFAARPGRFARIAGVVAVLLVTGVLLTRAAIGMPVVAMPAYLLIPLFALSALALAAPRSPSWPVRLLPLGVTVAAVLAAGAHLPAPILGGSEPVGSIWETSTWGYHLCCGYLTPTTYVLHLTAMAVLAAGVAVALGDAINGRARGAWTLLILLTPITLMETMRLYGVEPLARAAVRAVGSNELRVCLAGMLGALVTGVLLPLVTGQVVRLSRRRRVVD
ncbi:hypothetical protein ACTOB_000163 [Actinoplanes oblitus]|uniref:Uncharacterized protein n=1 Tax=Actinoplanes oblitus TaxID=3040509 RepID=A0ABY8WJL6_9ACTN|nr:hypothetical protein [Actinoplanes oblitus]WIM96703.1 hypothetical protein ACTOB_000163 [Actinoplanes oblitus]